MSTNIFLNCREVRSPITMSNNNISTELLEDLLELRDDLNDTSRDLFASQDIAIVGFVGTAQYQMLFTGPLQEGAAIGSLLTVVSSHECLTPEEKLTLKRIANKIHNSEDQ